MLLLYCSCCSRTGHTAWWLDVLVSFVACSYFQGQLISHTVNQFRPIKARIRFTVPLILRHLCIIIFLVLRLQIQTFSWIKIRWRYCNLTSPYPPPDFNPGKGLSLQSEYEWLVMSFKTISCSSWMTTAIRTTQPPGMCTANVNLNVEVKT